MTTRVRLVLISVLAAATLTYLVPVVYSTLTQPPSLDDSGFVATIRGGALTVVSVTAQSPSGEPTPAAAAGLVKGDRILDVGGPEGELRPIRSLADWGDALSALPPQGPWRVLAVQPPAASRILTIHPRPDQRFARRLWFGAVLPLLAVATAFFLGFMKPSSRHAFLACLLFLSFSSIFTDNYLRLPAGLRDFAVVWSASLGAFIVYLFMHFFLVFPSDSPIERRFGRLKIAMLAATIAYWLYALVTMLLLLHSFAAFSRWSGGVGRWAQWVYLALSIGMFVVGLTSLVLNTVRAPSRDDRRRMVILLTGTAAGLLPMVGVGFLALALGFENLPSWLLAVAVSMSALFPLSFVYAVLVHRALGIRVIVRRGLQYALVSRGFLAVEALAVAVGFLFAARPLLERIIPTGDIAWIMVATAAVTLAMAAGLRQLNRWVMRIIDRHFFREAYDAELVLAGLGRTTRQLAARPEQLLEVVAGTLAETLHTGSVAILLKEVEGPRDAATSSPTAPGDLRCVRVHTHPQSSAEAVRRAAPCQDRVLPAASRVAQAISRSAGTDPRPVELFPGHPLLLQLMHGDPADAQALRRREASFLADLDVHLILPIATGERVLGAIALSGKLSEEAFTRRDRELLQTVANQVAVTLDYAQLIAQVAERERLQHEIALAKEIQEQLLPRVMPELPGWEVSTLLLPAQEVAGDFFQLYPAEDGSLSLVVGDVSGKGLRAAMLVSLVLGAVNALVRETRDPAAVLDRLNDILCPQLRRAGFVSCAFAHLDAAHAEVTFANAGHIFPQQLEAATGSWHELAAPLPRLPLGVRPGLEYRNARIALGPGDRLVILSDGVVEAQSPDGELFGFDRLQQVLAAAQGPVADMAAHVVRAVQEHVGGGAPQDDISLVVLGRNTAPKAPTLAAAAAGVTP